MSFQEDIIQSTDSLSQKAKELNLGPLLEPDAVPFSFETIGWPILAAVVFLVLLIIAIWQIKRYKHNRYRRQALTELREISSGKGELSHVFVILKRTAILAFNRDKVGHLSGTTWLQFLEESGRNIEMLVFEKDIESLIYKDILPEKEVQQKLLSNAEKWIRTHAS